MAPFARLIRLCLMAILAFAGSDHAWAVGADGKAETPVIAAAVSVAVDGGKTRFSVTMSRSVVAQVQLMEGPDRVIVDLPEVAFHIPPDQGRRSEGLIASYRYGLFAPGRSRVVMELTQPAVVSALHVDQNQPGGASLLVTRRGDAEA